MKNKYLIYEVTSDAHTGLTREFSTKAEAVSYARCVRGDGWWAKVTDMRSDKVILSLSCSTHAPPMKTKNQNEA
jgi:hypothetical protein